ncbi:MAG: class I SAM-dependent methyltransferase [Thermoanaerobacteraceae bacterium]|nr:class I SAM-dependent methyltransferase [Thermoanaerobacteraceae bacterium]
MENEAKIAVEMLKHGKGKVLDVGTGAARMAAALSKYGYNVVSIEYDIDILKKAEENLKKEGNIDNIVLIHGDAHELPFLDETFGVVVTYNAMHHMKDYKRVLDEMVRVCSKDGFILVTELNEKGKEFVDRKHHERGENHEAKLNINDITEYLEGKFALTGEIKHSKYTDIFLCKKI